MMGLGIGRLIPRPKLVGRVDETDRGRFRWVINDQLRDRTVAMSPAAYNERKRCLADLRDFAGRRILVPTE